MLDEISDEFIFGCRDRDGSFMGVFLDLDSNGVAGVVATRSAMLGWHGVGFMKFTKMTQGNSSEKQKSPRELLISLREEKGLTLKELSKKSGVALTTIHSWETGKSLPKSKNRQKIAAFYKIDPVLLRDPVAEAKRPGRCMYLTEYETRPIMLHAQRWAQIDEMIKGWDVLDASSLIEQLVKDAHSAKKSG